MKQVSRSAGKILNAEKCNRIFVSSYTCQTNSNKGFVKMYTISNQKDERRTKISALVICG